MSTTTVLVTGSGGFIGKHLMEALGRRPEVRTLGYDLENTAEELDRRLAEADFIYHLAGVNRPRNLDEYQTGNFEFTRALCSLLHTHGRRPTIVLSSSIQAEQDNPYGISKRQAEKTLEEYARECTETEEWRKADGDRPPKAVIFRLQNVFGKWCRPNYNSVVATFCHNIAHDLPISISDPDKELELVYIDDVVAEFLSVLDENEAEITEDRMPEERKRKAGNGKAQGWCYRQVRQTHKVTLGELASKIRRFRESRKSLRLPSFADDFTRCLYATYLSYLEVQNFAYNLDRRTDNRGCLAEFMKSEHFGQIFVSRTKPGVTRGNHYHHTKAEKFLVVEGDAVMRFRSVQVPAVSGQPSVVSSYKPEVIEYRVSGRDLRVVDIPPGYTHSIENVGNTEMVVLFWASEIFDPTKPDTIALPVQQ